jgi:(p)ppGpp synthase/HD superfamily hydrolase
MTRQTASPRLTPKFVKALAYAAEKHGTQTRKGDDIPYLGHLLSVAGYVIEAGGTETEVAHAYDKSPNRRVTRRYLQAASAGIVLEPYHRRTWSQ